MTRRTAVAMLLVTLTGVATCARPLPPPGGDPDELPPRLVGTTPAPLAVVAASTEPVVLRFDETLSERGFSEALITVSPLDGALRVERSGGEVRIGIEGGWRADRIYRVVLLPGLGDRFGNTREDAVELVFSTGPPVPQTAIAGIVLDRITGISAVSPVVDAVRRADTVRYTAIADSVGFYSLRHIPFGVYDMRAYADANRNRRRDASEPVDSGRVVSLGVDTVPLMFHVLAPDSTTPVVTRASVIDSLHVRVTIDDYVTAEAAAAATADVLLLPDSTAYASATAILLEPIFAALEEAEPAPPDTTAAGDTLAVDTAGAATLELDEQAPGAAAPAVDTLPARELVITLDRPLLPGTEYVIVVRGLANLSGLIGSSSAGFETPAAVVPPPADTTQIRADTTRTAAHPSRSRPDR